MLLMAEKGVKGGICHSSYRYGKVNNKYMNYYDKNKEFSYLQYWNKNNLYGWAMSQKLPANKLEWISGSLNLMFNILKNYMKFLMIILFLPKKMKIEKVEKLAANLHDETEYIIHIKI